MDVLLFMSIQKLLQERPYDQDDWLISDRFGRGIDSRLVRNYVRKWCEEAGIEGDYGSITLRKTWVYHRLKQFFALSDEFRERGVTMNRLYAENYLGTSLSGLP